jgi:hypothetical protein
MNSKKTILLLGIVLSFYTNLLVGQFASFKQERPKSKNKFETNINPNSFSNSNRTLKTNNKVEKLAEKIINTLELNDSDANIIRNLCEDRAEKIEKIKLNNDNTQQKITDLQVVNQDFDNKIKQLVGINQYQKYETMRQRGN